jgi:hypothetical protein
VSLAGGGALRVVSNDVVPLGGVDVMVVAGIEA